MHHINKVSLNESPSEKEGKCKTAKNRPILQEGLNESPSEKEGKSASVSARERTPPRASMKALPKRKGNPASGITHWGIFGITHWGILEGGLNESPSEKEGKCLRLARLGIARMGSASMKALPKRKGNFLATRLVAHTMKGLNESPSEKEGKSVHGPDGHASHQAPQ